MEQSSQHFCFFCFIKYLILGLPFYKFLQREPQLFNMNLINAVTHAGLLVHVAIHAREKLE